MDLMKKKFQHPKGGPFGSKKSNMALVGPNLHSRTILQMQISFICMKEPRTELVPPLDDYRPTLLRVKIPKITKITLIEYVHNEPQDFKQYGTIRGYFQI